MSRIPTLRVGKIRYLGRRYYFFRYYFCLGTTFLGTTFFWYLGRRKVGMGSSADLGTTFQVLLSFGTRSEEGMNAIQISRYYFFRYYIFGT